MQFTAENITSSIGYLMGKAHRLLREAISHELLKNGVEIAPGYMPLMGILALHAPKKLSQRTLGELMELDRHRMSRALNELQQKGWVSLACNPKNKRENLVEMTHEGKDVLKTIGHCAGIVIEEAYDGVDAKSRQITENTLHQIITNLHKNELQEG